MKVVAVEATSVWPDDLELPRRLCDNTSTGSEKVGGDILQEPGIHCYLHILTTSMIALSTLAMHVLWPFCVK